MREREASEVQMVRCHRGALQPAARRRYGRLHLLGQSTAIAPLVKLCCMFSCHELPFRKKAQAGSMPPPNCEVVQATAVTNKLALWHGTAVLPATAKSCWLPG